MKKINYGWLICAASALLLFCTGGLGVTGFSAYQPYLINIGGLSNTQSSTVILFRTFFILIGMLCANRLIELFEIRRVVTVSLLICSVSFVLFGLSNGFTMYCFAAALMGFAVGFGGLISASVLIARWFNEYRGFAIGVSMAATGLSALAASPYITYVTEHYSLNRAFIIEGIFVFAVAIVVYAVIRSMPACLDTTPVGAETLDTDKTYAEKDAPKSLYIGMMIGIMLFGMPGNVFASHVSVIYSNSGYSSVDVATMVSLLGIALAIGKCVYGFISDKIGTYKASWLFYGMVLIGIGLTCLAGSGGRIVAYVAVLAAGFGFAVTTVSPAMYAATIATERTYGKTVSRFQIMSNIGALIFTTIPGIVADLTGSYIPAVIMMFVIAFISVLILQIIYSRLQ